jgi:hypothetical protein
LVGGVVVPAPEGEGVPGLEVPGVVVSGVVVSGAVVPGAAVSGAVVFGAVVSGAVEPGAAVEPGVVVPGLVPGVVGAAVSGVGEAGPGVGDAVPGVGEAVPGVGDAVPGVGEAVPGVGDAVEAPGFGVMLGFELEEGGVVLGVVLLVPGLCDVLGVVPGAAVPDCPPAAAVEPSPARISREVPRAISTGPASEAAGPGPGVVVVLAPLQVSATFVALAT